jgi:uncharacterized protein DUF6597
MFEYVPRPLGGETGRFVESIWFARGRIQGIRERIAPTGSTVAAVVLGDPIRQTPDGEGSALVADTGFLIGPHDRPIVNEPQGDTYCVGIVTTPVGCRPAFGLAPATLRGRVVDLLEAWPRAAALRRELSTCLTPAEALDIVEATLGTPEAFDRNAFVRCEAAVAQLSEDPTRPVGDIAAGLGVSHGHLDRQFTEQVGLSPRTLARILRMRRLLHEMDTSSPNQEPWPPSCGQGLVPAPLPHCCLVLPQFCLGRMENVGQRRATMRGHLRSSAALLGLFSWWALRDSNPRPSPLRATETCRSVA